LVAMQELEEFKTFLGPIAKDYTDPQLLQLRAEMRVMADLLLDIYLDKRNSGRTPKSARSNFDNSGDSTLEFNKGSAAEQSAEQK